MQLCLRFCKCKILYHQNLWDRFTKCVLINHEKKYTFKYDKIFNFNYDYALINFAVDR